MPITLSPEFVVHAPTPIAIAPRPLFEAPVSRPIAIKPSAVLLAAAPDPNALTYGPELFFAAFNPYAFTCCPEFADPAPKPYALTSVAPPEIPVLMPMQICCFTLSIRTGTPSNVTRPERFGKTVSPATVSDPEMFTLFADRVVIRAAGT